MLKNTILILALLFPVFAFSQDTDFTKKDVAKKVLGIVSSFNLDDHVGVFQINLSDTTFELVAIDDKLQLLWRSTYKGYGVTSGKLSNHILAISCFDHSRSKGFISPYNAYLIDEKTGKSIAEKEIFRQKAKYEEFAQGFFVKNDSEFNLVVRQAHRHSESEIAYYQDKTEDLNIVNVNDKLEVKTIKPKIPDATFVSMTCNRSGDFYILTYKEDKAALSVWKYNYGDIDYSSPITLEFGSLQQIDITSNTIAASETDRNVLYLGICHDNQKNDRTLITGKFDFNSHVTKIDTEIFTGSYKRSLQDMYKPVGPDFLKPTIGYAKSTLTVKYVTENNGKVVVALSESFFNYNGCYGYALIINSYDNDLKKLYHQLMPVRYSAPRSFESAFGLKDGFLNVVSNNFKGVNVFSLFGHLDLTTGEWLKLRTMSPDIGYFSDSYVIWLKDRFIVPYFAHSGLISSKCNIRLYVNEY